ncbi:hypothetical protein ACEPAF_1450 [Sanghuangporus sanghuang]
MFTPPPSPLPVPRIIVTDESESESESGSDSRLRIEEEGKRKKKDKNSSGLDSASPFYIIPSSQPGEKSGSSGREEQQQTKMKVQVAPTQAQAHAEAIIRDYERKKRTARRTRWAVLLVPAVLVLVALTSRRVLTPFGAPDELEEALDRGIDVNANVNVNALDGMKVGDDAALLVPSRSEVRTDSVVASLQGDSERHGQTYRIHHIQNHKRQTLSLTDPAAPSSSVLITPDASNSALSSDSGSVSPTGTDSSSSPTTTVPQTEQTIPPVPDTSNPPALPTPFPQPFDTTGATSNVTTQTCANFFTNMTQTLPFRSCRPFSLLEQFSSEFIEAQTNLTLLNTLIFGTCTTSTPLDTCTANMDWFASSLTSFCSTEVSQNNLLVAQTLLGLQSYALLRQAACLVNQQSNTYCYASAAHDSSPADLYLYQLPLGIGFPVSTTQPSCSTCAKSILALYAEALRGGNSSASGLEETYEPAASQAESVCGTGFAAVGVATEGTSGAAGSWRSWGSWGSWSAVVMSACVLASSVLVWL